MDTLKEYVKMCYKADKYLKYEFKDGDLYVCICYENPTMYESSIKDISIVGHYKHPQINAPALNLQKAMDKSKPRDTLLCRIHRQDQLQDMIEHANGKWVNTLSRFNVWWSIGSMLEDINNKYGSMEQLWLAFIMQEKYNKIWDGEDWKGK